MKATRNEGVFLETSLALKRHTSLSLCPDGGGRAGSSLLGGIRPSLVVANHSIIISLKYLTLSCSAALDPA